MCEKPFTIDPADAWDLDQTVKRTGNQLFIAARSSTSRCTWIR